MGSFSYQNQLYVPTPNPITNLTGSPQPKSVALFGGNVGATAKPGTPTDGVVYLVQSGFGQPVAEPRRADFLIAQEIVPDPALQVDLSKAPDINPPVKAFYLADVQKIFANEPGFVQITWKKADNTPVGPVKYLIDTAPVRAPVAVYHTHNLGADFTSNPLPVPQTQAPLVDVSSVQQVIFHWNTALPDSPLSPYFVRAPNNQLYAKDKTGLIVLEYRQLGQFLGIEIVQLRSNLVPDFPPSLADIGWQMLPSNPALAPVPPIVTKGLGTTPDTQYVYQHSNPNSIQNGALFAVRKTADPSLIEVYWMTRGVQNVVWPYELHRYTTDWPSNPAKFQRYVRAVAPVIGPDVKIPSGINATLMPFQEPPTHANPVAGATFSTSGPGWSLLKYDLTNDVAFQVVRSLDHMDASVNPNGTSQFIARNIGEEVTDPLHQGPRGGFVYLPGGTRYDWEIYDGKPGDPEAFKTQQIIPVNTGTLEVWWSTLNQGVQWPSFVKRYQDVWPTTYSKIVIASLKGGGAIDPVAQQDYRLYFQNDPALPGFNPNDEHALISDGGQGQAVFALRDDLGTPSTSDPYCLLKYRDPSANLKWKYTVYKVVSEESPYTFNYPGVAGTLIQPPYPLSVLQLCTQSVGVSGPYWQDRKSSFWARAAGNDGGAAQIVMRYFYPAQPGFFFPDSNPGIGACVPWLDRRPGGTPGTPADIKYTVTWPTNSPELRIGETLVKAKFGLPDISQQTSAQIIYDQVAAQGNGINARLIDPTHEFHVSLAQLPPDIQSASESGLVYFTALPPQLQSRFFYESSTHFLKFRGQLVVPPAGEYYLLLNVITAREKTVLLSLSTDAAYQAAVNALAAATATLTDVPPDSDGFDSMALTAGFAQGNGYVTLAFGNNPKLSAPAEPISLAVIKVGCPSYRGEVKVIASPNPFDEKLTLRHSGDFAGQADAYVFEWRTRAPVNGLPPADPPDQWNSFSPVPATGQGALDITIQGPGLFTLSDNYFICRYRRNGTALCATANNPLGWSDWTDPMLAEGWIKRVVRAINPFEQRFSSYANNQVNTMVSMISQAGAPFHGGVALNAQAANSLGLIEAYETIFRRGRSLSIEGLPAVNYGPANDALLLAAGRLADLYMLLGNEAYADAADPTIAFGTDDKVYGSASTSIHCFMNQTVTLMDEELALLRGRDDTLLPSATTFPFYNRLIWNFTSSLDGGEVAYALNYNIRAQDGSVSGTISEADAKALYPQGHGDAWGHYLSAIKNYYRLLKSPNFTWVPRIEAVLVGGVPVSVDYYDERKFAKAAAARARTGAEIVNLTYRSAYDEDPAHQWQGYTDSRTNRAWGLAEWGSRAGQGALFDWIAGNALLPDQDLDPTHTGIQKIDRTTVLELRDVASAFDEIQSKVDQADGGLNPLGLAKNVIPFDIDPALVAQGKTHFEQIYDRAVQAVNNAITVFNRANNSTQLLRRQADTVTDFQKAVGDREADFKNRLVEIFGYPYGDDIGPTGAYPTGYDGPDIYHFDYVEASKITGQPLESTQQLTVTFNDVNIGPQGEPVYQQHNVVYNISGQNLGMVKPAGWSLPRRAPGQIQIARSDVLQAYARFLKALDDYKNLIAQIEDRALLLKVQQNVAADEVEILRQNQRDQIALNDHIFDAKVRADEFIRQAHDIELLNAAIVDGLPKVVGLATDPSGPIRAAYRAIIAIGVRKSELGSAAAQQKQLQYEQDKEIASLQEQITLTTSRNSVELTSDLQQLLQLIRQESSARLELFNAGETLNQASDRYRSAIASGERLLDDRLRFRQETAAQVQSYRYKDMAFRIFRNDALQKYRAQFDLASMYVYLAARTYDYETSLKKGDPRGPGSDFMTGIIRSRALGLVENGQPQTGSGFGDAGLSDPMARMLLDWQLVLKGQLGFNNPQTETGRFSLRSELFRIQAGSAGRKLWSQTLERNIVTNVLAMPEFSRYCIPFQPQLPVEPAIVIPFATSINFGQNFFGWPLGGGDNNYDSTHFVTKIRSVGVWFANYDNLGLVNTPRVYLIPVGDDVMRSPSSNLGDLRQWKVLDQRLPVPFPLTPTALSSPTWIPINDSLSGVMADIRQYAQFLAHTDAGTFNPSDTTSDTRLIGRSVWNTRWLLIIPAGSLLSDRNEAMQRFINGALLPNGQRDGNGVTDIKIFFQTYAYSGN